MLYALFVDGRGDAAPEDRKYPVKLQGGVDGGECLEGAEYAVDPGVEFSRFETAEGFAEGEIAVGELIWPASRNKWELH